MREHTNFAWAAGLFEGEGSLDIKKSDTHGYHYEYLRLQLTSTDYDVLLRFKTLVGVGGINGPYRDFRKKRLGKKPHWKWQVSGVKALHLVQKLKLYFGKRRTQKLKQLLKGHPQWTFRNR